MQKPSQDEWLDCHGKGASQSRDDDENSWANDEDWLREEAERQHLLITSWGRFSCLKVTKNCARLPRKLVLGLQGFPDDQALVHDIAWFEYGLKNDILDSVEKVTFEYTSSFPAQPLIELFSILGKLPRLTNFKVVTPHQAAGYCPFPVQALAELFKNAHRIRKFHSNMAIYGVDRDFHQWAAALRKCSLLERLTCIEQMPEIAVDRHRAINTSTMWEPVVRAIVENNTQRLKELSIVSLEERGMVLTAETSRWLVQLKERNCLIDVNDFALRLSDLEHVVSYSSSFQGHHVDVDRRVRINFLAEAPQNDFIRHFMNKVGFRLPSFDISFHAGFPNMARRAKGEKYESVIDIQLCKELIVNPTQVHSLVAAKVLSQEHAVGVEDLAIQNEKDLYLYTRLQEENLWDFNPCNALKGEWADILSILGNVSLGIRYGRLAYDLTPLYSLIAEHPNRVVDMVLNTPNFDQCGTLPFNTKEHLERLEKTLLGAKVLPLLPPAATEANPEWSLQTQLESLQLDPLQFSTRDSYLRH